MGEAKDPSLKTTDWREMKFERSTFTISPKLLDSKMMDVTERGIQSQSEDSVNCVRESSNRIILVPNHELKFIDRSIKCGVN